jgi:hypothetical protein
MDLTNPQSLNRYTYVMNNPVSGIDRLGLDGKMCGDDEIVGGICPGDRNFSSDYADWNCSVDGFMTSCATAFGMLDSGAAAECPAAGCGPISTDGVLVHFVAYITGSTYMPYAGPGSILDTNNQAMLAGALYAENQSLLTNGKEHCGVTSAVGDDYTYSAPVQGTGDDCDPRKAMDSDYQQIAGAYHGHGVFDPANRMSEISDFPPGHSSDQWFSNFWSLPLSLATPGGNLIIYYPKPGCQTFFLGGPAGTGTTIPICR